MKNIQKQIDGMEKMIYFAQNSCQKSYKVLARLRIIYSFANGDSV